jgi:putative transposase
MCRVYGVTPAGYYAWRKRPPSARARQDQTLKVQIERVHQESRGTYGSPRVYRQLKSQGVEVGENRVARLMRAHGIKSRSARRSYNRPHMKRHYAAIANAACEVEVDRPDQVWVGDITYLKVGGVYRYLAVVMDKYSRRIVGSAFGRDRHSKLTLRALNRAAHNRRPPPGLIFHSDRAMEYTCLAYQARLAKLRFVQSVNRPNSMNDNVHIESFFHSMKSDIVHGKRFDEDREIVAALYDYMPFYNNTRLHSSLGYVPPATYEQQSA